MCTWFMTVLRAYNEWAELRDVFVNLGYYILILLGLQEAYQDTGFRVQGLGFEGGIVNLPTSLPYFRQRGDISRKR